MNGKELTRTPKGHGFPSGCHPPHPQRSPQRSAAGPGRCEHERKWNHFIRHNLTLFARCDEEHHTGVGETPVASPPLARISVRVCVPAFVSWTTHACLASPTAPSSSILPTNDTRTRDQVMEPWPLWPTESPNASHGELPQPYTYAADARCPLRSSGPDKRSGGGERHRIKRRASSGVGGQKEGGRKPAL
jgi:hypothetical protein